MRPFILHIICIIALFTSCDWVNDDLSKCPSGTWLKISYTYNILNVEAASTQVGDISILAFDTNNKYVDRVDVDSITLHKDYCMVKIPFPEGTYHFIVWGGTSGETFQHSTLIPGETERESISLSLTCDDQNRQKGRLKGFFYSSLENITVSNDYQVFTASLVKNTNYFSCMLQNEAGGLIQPDDFAFMLESANGTIDHENRPIGTMPVYYYAYQDTIFDQAPVVHARLNTLRITEGDNTMLSIKHRPSGQRILHLPLTQYLLVSKDYIHIGYMDDQEYLDRQDAYRLLFFVRPSETDVPEISPLISVNDWTVRIDFPELEN